MKRKFWFGSIGLIVFLSIILISSWLFSRQSSAPTTNLFNNQPIVNRSEPDLSTATSVSPMLAQAQPVVKLPQDSEFMVSGGSATATIRFIEGSIKPLDVHVGNTQNFRIVVTSPNGIKRVVAEIETDNGIFEVELTREGLISILDTYPNPYTVNPQDNTLKILNQDQLVQARLSEHQRELAQTKTGQANAAAGQREVWTGSWVVKDTHDKAYFTNFVAYDSVGNQEKMTMTWTDLCLIPLGGNWDMSNYPTSTCSVASTVDGVDNGDIFITAGKTLNLQAAGNFIWNPGNSVHFDGGQLILAANKASQLSQGYLYVRDADNDWHSAPNALSMQTSTNSTTTPAGYRRRSILISTNDCNDNNGQVVPSAASYHTTSFINSVNPSLIYDWDCNGSVSVNPLFDKACLATRIEFNSIYRYRTCQDFDSGGCCGLGGGGVTYTDFKYEKKGDYNFWSTPAALALDDLPCCDTSTTTADVCNGTFTINNSYCGQNVNLAYQISFGFTSGCGGTRFSRSGYVNQAVSCK